MQQWGCATVRRRRRGSWFCQCSLSLRGGQERGPEGTAACRVWHAPSSAWGQGPALLLWSRQIDRQRCFCVFCWWVGGCRGPSPVSESPSVSSPQSVSPGQWAARPHWQPSGWPSHCELLARRRSLVAHRPGKPARMEVLGEWIFSVTRTALKGRSVTRWSRGRHLSNKRRLHKITTWIIAFLSSLHTKSSGKREGNSLVGSLSVSLLSRNSWDGEGIPRICPHVQGS